MEISMTSLYLSYIITAGIILHTAAQDPVLLCDFDQTSDMDTNLPCFCSGTPCVLVQNIDDRLDWMAWHGQTPSNPTGPEGDHTTGTGMYIYSEASNQNPGHDAILSTPSLTLSTASCLTFWYHMFGQHIGSLTVDVRYTSGAIEQLWAKTKNQSVSWLEANVPLRSDVVEVTITSLRGGTDAGMPFGDIALDDITIMEQNCLGATDRPDTTTTSTSTSIPLSSSSTSESQTNPSTTSTITPPTSTSMLPTTSTSTNPTPPTTPPTPTPTTPSTESSTAPPNPVTSISPPSVTITGSSTTARAAPSTGPEDSFTTTSIETGGDTQQELWGLDETLWIIILVVAGAVILVLLVIVCVQACAMRRMRTARIVRQPDDMENFQGFNRDVYTNRDTGNNKEGTYINAYDNEAMQEDDKIPAHTNGGYL